MSVPIPIDALEERAGEARFNLRRDVKHIRSTLKHNLNPKENLREHLWPIAGVSGVVAIGLGYVATAVFLKGNQFGAKLSV